MANYAGDVATHSGYVCGFVHISTLNLLYVDGHIESKTFGQAPTRANSADGVSVKYWRGWEE